MVNPETMVTLGTQDTGRRKTKHGKLKKKSVIKLISFFFLFANLYQVFSAWHGFKLLTFCFILFNY